MAQELEGTTIKFTLKKVKKVKKKKCPTCPEFCYTVSTSQIVKTGSTGRIVNLTRGDGRKEPLDVWCDNVHSRNAFDPPWRKPLKLEKGKPQTVIIRADLGLDTSGKKYCEYVVQLIAGDKDNKDKGGYSKCDPLHIIKEEHTDFHIEC